MEARMFQYQKITAVSATYLLVADEHGKLVYIGEPDGSLAEIEHAFKTQALQANHQLFAEAEGAMTAYLTGAVLELNLPVGYATGTPFQQAVWTALQKVPYGETVTYTELATMVGRPTAVRAVASAVGKNPLPLIVPCHRVVRKDGTIGQFRWGVSYKRRLLQLEGISLPWSLVMVSSYGKLRVLTNESE